MPLQQVLVDHSWSYKRPFSHDKLSVLIDHHHLYVEYFSTKIKQYNVKIYFNHWWFERN